MVSNSISAGQLEFPVKFETFNCRNGFLGVDYIYLVISHDRMDIFKIVIKLGITSMNICVKFQINCNNICN